MHRLQAENFVLFCIKFFLGENADINQFLQFLHRLDLFFHRHGCRVRGGSSGFRRRRRRRRLNRGGRHRINGLCHIHAQQHATIAKAVVLDGSHDDQRSHRRKLHSDLPVSTWRQDRDHPSCDRMVICHRRNPDQSILGILSEMGFLRALYRHGLDLRTGIYTIAEFFKSGGFRMAAGRWYHLHRWRRNLCVEASDL